MSDEYRERNRAPISKVYVGNLNEIIKREDLESQFKKYGKISNVWVAFNPPGFAFVEFDNEEDAETACENMNGVDVLGAKLRVEMAREKQRRGGSGGRGFRTQSYGGSGRYSGAGGGGGGGGRSYGGERFRGPANSGGGGGGGGRYQGGGGGGRYNGGGERRSYDYSGQSDRYEGGGRSRDYGSYRSSGGEYNRNGSGSGGSYEASSRFRSNVPTGDGHSSSHYY